MITTLSANRYSAMQSKAMAVLFGPILELQI